MSGHVTANRQTISSGLELQLEGIILEQSLLLYNGIRGKEGRVKQMKMIIISSSWIYSSLHERKFIYRKVTVL